MTTTFWTAPNLGATLGELRRRAGRINDADTDDVKTSLGLGEGEWHDYDGKRLDEVERRVREHGADLGY